MLKNLWNKIERLTPFFIFSFVLFLLLIGSNFSMLLFYSILFFSGIILLIYAVRRKKKNQKIKVTLIIFLCMGLIIFGLLDLISELLNIFVKDQMGNLKSLSHMMHVCDIFFESLTFFFLGWVLISKRIITDMGWMPNQTNDIRISRSLRNLKILGILVIFMSFVLAARTAYIYFVLIPELQR